MNRYRKFNPNLSKKCLNPPKSYYMDMWSVRSFGPKGGRKTIHKLLVTVVNSNDIKTKYSYTFNTLESLYQKKLEIIKKISLKSRLPIVQDYTMINAWYLMPRFSDNEEDLFHNKNYIDELCYTDWIKEYTDRKWVINCNKFSTEMEKNVA